MKKIRETTVISIGIDNYKESPLTNCSNDAITFYDALLSNNYNLNEEKSVCLTSKKSDLNISKSEILKAIDGLIKNSSENELTIFYFSGHGTQRKTNNKQDYYLVVQDDAGLEDNLIDFSEIKEKYKKSKAKNKIIILDTCYSGALLKDESKVDSNKFREKIFKNTKGFYILASSTSEQTSSNTSTSNINLSLFTNYLVEAFRGNPKALQDNKLTIFSLYTYLSKNVTNISRFNKEIQEPTIDAKAVHVLELADFSNSSKYEPLESNILSNVNNITKGKVQLTELRLGFNPIFSILNANEELSVVLEEIFYNLESNINPFLLITIEEEDKILEKLKNSTNDNEGRKLKIKTNKIIKIFESLKNELYQKINLLYQVRYNLKGKSENFEIHSIILNKLIPNIYSARLLFEELLNYSSVEFDKIKPFPYTTNTSKKLDLDIDIIYGQDQFAPGKLSFSVELNDTEVTYLMEKFKLKDIQKLYDLFQVPFFNYDTIKWENESLINQVLPKFIDSLFKYYKDKDLNEIDKNRLDLDNYLIGLR